MKPLIYVFFGICLVFFGIIGFSFFNQPSSAQKNARVQWEYSTIVAAYSLTSTRERTNKITGSAVICYIQSTGCRLAEVKHEIDYSAFLQERAMPVIDSNNTRTMAGHRASEIAFQKALAQLGSEGWEIISEPKIDFELLDSENYIKFEDKSVFFNRTNTKAVYFKRLKTQ